MVVTVINEARRRNPRCRIGVLCADAPLPPLLHKMNLVPEPIWRGVKFGPFFDIIGNYDAVAVVGADIMDGYYSTSDAMRNWAFADLAARAGLKSFVVGFSFNSTPASALGNMLRDLSPALEINPREEVSRQRFVAASGRHVELAADSAFLLPSTPNGPDQHAVEEWCVAQRREGRIICAFNTHPMVFKDFDTAKTARLNAAFATAIRGLAQQFSVAFLFIPHDFRDPSRGDAAALAQLHDQVKGDLKERVFFAASEARATELKALVGVSDLLITGRMHLAIAALSNGIPVWAVNSQQKFIGLYQHFGLPDLRIVPEAALEPGSLSAFMAEALAEWPAVGEKIRAALPDVKAKAARNFAMLDGMSAS